MAIIAIVEVDGQRFETGPDNRDLISGSVNLVEGKKSSSATIEIADPFLTEATTRTIPTKSTVVPLDVWFGEGPTPPKVFAGYVSGFRVAGPPPRLEFTATDKSKTKRRKARSKNHANTSVEALARELAKAAGLTVDLSKADLADVRLAQAVQFGETDWAFLSRVLEGLGHQIKVRGSQAIVTRIGDTRSTSPAAELIYGEHIVSYSFTADEKTSGTTPNVFDLAGNKQTEDEDEDAAETQARATRLERIGLITTADDFPSFTVEAQAEALKRQAKAKRRKVFHANIVSSEPLPLVDTDDFVTLIGFGTRWSGVWNVEAVSHDLRAKRTSLKLYNGGSA